MLLMGGLGLILILARNIVGYSKIVVLNVEINILKSLSQSAVRLRDSLGETIQRNYTALEKLYRGGYTCFKPKKNGKQQKEAQFGSLIH